MTQLIDKFSIISNVKNKSNITKINYIENYLNDNYICHSELIKNDTCTEQEIIIAFKNYIRKNKNNFARMIKYGKIDLDTIISFVKICEIKSDYICNLTFNINFKPLIFELIFIQPFIDKILINYIVQQKSLQNFITYFDKYSSNDKMIESFNLKLSNFLRNNLKDVDINIFSNAEYINLAKTIDYFIKCKNIYKYLSNDVFSQLHVNICNIIGNLSLFSKNNECLLLFYESMISKINYTLNNSSSMKPEIQEKILYFSPTNFDELYNFMIILNNLDIDDKNIIMNKFININKNIITIDNIKNLSQKIDMNVKNKVSNTVIYQFINNTKYNQDLNINMIVMYLIKRYIYFDNFDIEYENYEYKSILSCIPAELLYKYNKVLSEINDRCDITIPGDPNLNQMTKISPSWNLNIDFQKYYEFNIENNKYARVYLHIGEINTIFKTDIGEYNIRMLPMHYDFLNKIKNRQLFNIHELYKLYNSNYLDIVFNQLLENEIIKYENSEFIINKQYNNGDIDLIKLLNYHIEEKSDDIIEDKIINETAHEREDIIMTNINSILKELNKNINMSNLKSIVKERLALYFDITDKMFNSVINRMKILDYISIITNNNYTIIEKLIY